ncbi:hypothetical protein GCM10010381_68070 [Streptomyces xantholiticus]|nr:hypothetical protein GCM10010381_68070 [Streptomyces xantholiticus]
MCWVPSCAIGSGTPQRRKPPPTAPWPSYRISSAATGHRPPHHSHSHSHSHSCTKATRDQACDTAAKVFDMMTCAPLPGRMRSLIGDFHRDLPTRAPDAAAAREWGDLPP